MDESHDFCFKAVTHTVSHKLVTIMKTLKTLGTALMTVALMSFTLIDSAAIADWASTEINLGEIEHNVPTTATFELTNTGDGPLIIQEAKPSCGCTVADYPRRPIEPGETVEIKAQYNARTLGNFRKTVTVTTNTEVGTYDLVLRGKVIE